MVKLSRNEKCLCGSGKKYKNCCLRKGIEYKDLLYKKQDKNLVALLKDLLTKSDVDVPNRTEIICKIRDINNFMERELVGVSKRTFTERMVINNVFKMINDSYLDQVDNNCWDRECISLYIETLIDIVSNDLTEISPIKSITINAEKGKYQNSEFIYFRESWEELFNSNKFSCYSIDVYINEKDELYKSFRYYHNLYKGLEELSIKNICTALFLEKQIPESSRDLISYVGLYKYYDGVLEQEFRKVIELKEGWIFKKDYMFKKIIEYLEDNELEFIHSNIPNLINQMNRIVEYRNKISHGEWITYEEFKEIKDFCFDKKVFKYISMLTIELRSDQLQNELGFKLNSELSSEGSIALDIFKPILTNKQKTIKLLLNLANLCCAKKPNFREIHKMVRLIEQKAYSLELGLNKSELMIVLLIVQEYNRMKKNAELNWDREIIYLLSMSAAKLLKECTLVNDYPVKYLFIAKDKNGKFIDVDVINSCHSHRYIKENIDSYGVYHIPYDQTKLYEEGYDVYDYDWIGSEGLEKESVKELIKLLFYVDYIQDDNNLDLISYDKLFKDFYGVLVKELYHFISLSQEWKRIKPLTRNPIIMQLKKVKEDSLEIYNADFVKDFVDLTMLRKEIEKREVVNQNDFYKIWDFCMGREGLSTISSLKLGYLEKSLKA